MKNLFKGIALSVLCALSIDSFGQTEHKPLSSIQYGENPKLHARGLTANKKKIFVAASDGKLYIIDLKTETVEERDYHRNVELRDIEVSKKYIILLASGDSSSTISINRKNDEYVINEYEGLFLDGISLVKNSLFMMGDPMSDRFMLFNSNDNGESWTQLDSLPQSIQGEAGFAASGTNVQMTSIKNWYFVSGGMDSRFYSTNDAGKTWNDSELGFKPCESCGAYSFIILPDNKTIVSVGGDYTKPDERIGTSRISNDGGTTWHSPKVDLMGYRSNVMHHRGIIYACGTNGIDVSTDFGESWSEFATGNYFIITVFKKQLVASTIEGTLDFYSLQKKK
ncbi:MAG: sialidase family protein [Crocinitomicaceae bacterium]|jgi:photosystem II stability/assembly factor-like uncharacterized protein